MSRFQQFSIFYLFGTLAPVDAEARSPWIPAQECDLFAKVNGRIEFCTENPTALESAKACEKKLREAWTKAGADMKHTLTGLQSRDETRQKIEFSLAKADYDRTLDDLQELIEFTQRNGDRVAQYPKALADSPLVMEDPEESHACFKEPDAEIRAIVAKIDQMILDGLATFDIADGHFNKTSDSDRDILAVIEQMEVFTGRAEGFSYASPPPADYQAFTGESPRENSDITGTRKAIQDEIVADFKVRDQLFSP